MAGRLQCLFQLVGDGVGGDEESQSLEILLQVQRLVETFDRIGVLADLLRTDTIIFKYVEILLLDFFLVVFLSFIR